MRFKWLFLMAVVAAVGGSACQPAADEPEELEEPEAPAEEVMSDEDMLREETDAFVEAWANGDAAGIAALFVPEGDMVDPAGQHYQGRDAIQQRYEELFAGIYQGTTLSVTQESVDFPAPDVAIVNGTYTVSGITTPDDEEMTVNGLYTNVGVKEGGEWMIHSSRPMVPAPQPSSGT